MSDIEKLDCEQSRDQLDMLIETMVEARIKAEVDPIAGRLALVQNSFEPQGALREHLAACNDCHNYQLANRVIIEAARSLPKLESDEALTQSILAMIEADQKQEMVAADHLQSAANQSEAMQAAAPPAKAIKFSLQNPYILAVTALAFILLVSTSSGFTMEALWSATSWVLALLMVAMLKPLVEGNSGLPRQIATNAKA